MTSIKAWSLITVTYNNADDLRRFAADPLPADVEWIVVDNHSRDESVKVALSLGATVISLSENAGFGRANNVGLRDATGAHVGFVNPDLRVNYDDLPTIARLLDEAAQDCLIAPQLIDPDGTAQPNGRGVPTVLRKLSNRLNLKNTGYRIYANPGEQVYVAWAIGAAIFGKRATIDALGGWNEAFFVYYEDHDLGLRAWDHGIPTILTGDVRWVHGWARETTTLSLRPWLLEIHGASKFFRRYPGLLFSHRLLGRRYRRMNELIGRSVAEIRTPGASTGEGEVPGDPPGADGPVRA
jgi:N-acetylglucosaminyl-diphospho-decaprenol L-rhamnosyltransferase